MTIRCIWKDCTAEAQFVSGGNSLCAKHRKDQDTFYEHHTKLLLKTYLGR